MHACARSDKQKYASIYIYIYIYIFLDENVFENGCIYIYICMYVCVYVHIFNNFLRGRAGYEMIYNQRGA